MSVTMPVKLNGVDYLADLTKLSRRPLPVFRAGDYSGEANEQALASDAGIRRSQTDWSLGAGQEFLDSVLDASTGDASSRRRFWRSEGVDIWSEPGKLKLLRAPSQVGTIPSGSTATVYSGDGASVLSVSNSVGYTITPTASGNTVVNVGTLPGSGNTDMGATFDGVRWYIALFASASSNFVYTTTGSGYTAFSTVQCRRIEYVGYAEGRLMAAYDNEIFELSGAGAKVNAYTHPDTSGVWTAIVGTPVGIFAAFRVGDRTRIFFIEDDEAGGLTTPTIAAELNVGEYVTDMVQSGGVLVLGTNLGFRVAEYGRGDQAGGTLRINRLVQPETFNAFPPGDVKLAAGGRFVWFTWRRASAFGSGLGRMDLASTTVPGELVPAYAMDLVVTSNVGFLPRVAVATFEAISGGVVTGYDLRPYYGSFNSGVWTYHHENLASSGFVDVGRVGMGLIEEKNWTQARVDMDPLPAGATVTFAAIEADDTTVETLATVTATGARTSGWASASSVLRAGWCTPRIFLNRATTTTVGPKVTDWALEGKPAFNRATGKPAYEIVVPIIAKTQVSNLDGSVVTQDPLGILEALEALILTGAPVTYQEGSGRTETVTVTGVAILEGDVRAVQGPGGTRDWVETTLRVVLQST